MKNNLKRLLSVFVALLMVLSVSVSVFALDGQQTMELPLESKKSASYDLSGMRNGKTFDISDEYVAEEIAADQIVPIMVELKDAPAMAKYSQYKDAKSYAASLLEKQDTAVKSIRNTLGVDVEVLYNYTLLFNGFGFEGEYRLVEELNKMDGIRAFVAAEWETPRPQLFSSTGMVGAPEAWDLDYTGEGKIVAIIDTGLEVDHPAFSNPPANPRFTKNDIGAIISGGELDCGANGNVNNIYYSAKIPFRWNYVKHTYNVNHGAVGSDHGTHVAGIAAGNGGEIVGVAKDAQIAAMNVFNDGGGAGWQAILLALEDCVVLGVDSANMSLGSPCGFTHYYDPSYGEVFENIVNAGVNLAVSAGNEYSTALRNAWNPTGIGYALSFNPDYGVTGSPSTWAESLGVASVDNAYQQMNYIENVANGAKYSYTENSENATQLVPTFGGQTLDFVAVPGYGDIGDFQLVDVTGKVAVVSRGEINFVTKGQNAQAAGAIACIVYNNTDGSVNMVSDPTITIPFIFCLKDAGDEMAEMGEGQIYIATEPAVLEAPGAGLPSDFSSWGTTSDLFMKPEIAAPGGNIYSSTDPSISNTLYDTWSGTSMAAPHVTGGMAIVTQYVEEMFPNATKGEQQHLVDAILMSTADPVNDTAGSFASVRKQGAGLMDLASAVTTTSYLAVPGSVRPKIQLGDDPEQTGVYEISFQVVNFGEDALVYEAVPYVLTDDLTAIDQDLDGNLVIAYTQTSWDITEYCTVEGPETIEVPAGETVDVNMTITVDPSIIEYYNTYTYGVGFYVEGFIELVDASTLTGDVNADGEVNTVDVLAVMRHVLELEELEDAESADINGDGVVDMSDALILLRHVLGIEQSVNYFVDPVAATELNLPFLGFCGDWNYSPMFDEGFYYDDYSYGSNPQVNFIGSVYDGVGYGLGINPYIETEDLSYYNEDRNAVSPNEDGFLDTADTIRLGLMRNASEAGYELINANGEVIASLAHQNEVRKSYYSTNNQVYYNLGTDMPLVKWNAAPYAGQDIAIRAYAYLANDGSVTTNAYTPGNNMFDEWIIPIYVDVEAPDAEVVSYEDGVLTIIVHDNHYAAYAAAFEGTAADGAVELGDMIDQEGIFEEERDAETELILEGVEEGNIVCIADYAGNEVAYVFDGETLEPAADSWSHQNHTVATPDLDIIAFGDGLSAGGAGTPWLSFNTLDIGAAGIPGGMSSDESDYKCGGAVVGAKIYGINSSNQLVYLDAGSSAWQGPTVVGTVSASNVYEIAYNPADGNLYGASGFNDIYRINMQNGSATKVCEAPYGVVAMDFGPDGTLYVIDIYGALSVIDLATGEYLGDIVESFGINPVNLSTGNLYPQCGAIMGNWFVWIAIDYTISDYNQITMIACNVTNGDYVDMGPAYVTVSSGNLYYWPKCIFGTENEPFVMPDNHVDPVDFYENFEDLEFHWTNVDADGDGYVWGVEYVDDELYFDGSRAVISYSWLQGPGVLYPDNYMISEPFEVGEGEKYLNFFTSSKNTSEMYDEHFQVLVIPNGGELADAIPVYEYTLDTAALTEHLVSLEGFDGETIQLVFRHCDTVDMYTLIIDAIGVGDLID